MLKPGQIFCTTGPATRITDTPIRRAQAHAEKISSLILQGEFILLKIFP